MCRASASAAGSRANVSSNHFGWNICYISVLNSVDQKNLMPAYKCPRIPVTGMLASQDTREHHLSRPETSPQLQHELFSFLIAAYSTDIFPPPFCRKAPVFSSFLPCKFKNRTTLFINVRQPLVECALGFLARARVQA